MCSVAHEVLVLFCRQLMRQQHSRTCAYCALMMLAPPSLGCCVRAHSLASSAELQPLSVTAASPGCT